MAGEQVRCGWGGVGVVLSGERGSGRGIVEFQVQVVRIGPVRPGDLGGVGLGGPGGNGSRTSLMSWYLAGAVSR